MSLSSKNFENLKLELKNILPHTNGENVPPQPRQVRVYQRLLRMTRLHDVFYLQLNLCRDDLQNFSWVYGLEKLGYENGELNLVAFINRIHEKYRPFFLDMARLIYTCIQASGEKLVPYKHMYTIYFPLQKKNGKYVWVKQMSVPAQVDEYGNMIQQLNGYMIICQYNGVQLPPAPKVFDEKGARMVEFERQMFSKYLSEKEFQLSPTQNRILRAVHEIEKRKTDAEKEKSIKKYRTSVTHKEVEENLNSEKKSIMSSQNIKRKTSEIHSEMEKVFGRDFINLVEVMYFLRALRYEPLMNHDKDMYTL